MGLMSWLFGARTEDDFMREGLAEIERATKWLERHAALAANTVPAVEQMSRQLFPALFATTNLRVSTLVGAGLPAGYDSQKLCVIRRDMPPSDADSAADATNFLSSLEFLALTFYSCTRTLSRYAPHYRQLCNLLGGYLTRHPELATGGLFRVLTALAEDLVDAGLQGDGRELQAVLETVRSHKKTSPAPKPDEMSDDQFLDFMEALVTPSR